MAGPDLEQTKGWLGIEEKAAEIDKELASERGGQVEARKPAILN